MRKRKADCTPEEWERIAARAAKYYAANVEKFRAHNARYYAANREKFKAYFAANAGKIRAYQSQRKYGVVLTLGTCEICSGPATTIDHCHSTKRVRGTLCAPCNLGIGNARDSVVVLHALAAYADGHETWLERAPKGQHKLHALHSVGTKHRKRRRQEFIASRGGRCEACGVAERLYVDHNHRTGQLRGVLCKGCNSALGCFGDSGALLRKAAVYLERQLDLRDAEQRAAWEAQRASA